MPTAARTAAPRPVNATAVTRVMRGLIPHATLSTAAGTAPGQFTIRMPRTSAVHLGLANESGRNYVGSYLSRHLGTSADITDVQVTRQTARSTGTAIVNLQLGASCH